MQATPDFELGQRVKFTVERRGRRYPRYGSITQIQESPALIKVKVDRQRHLSVMRPGHLTAIKRRQAG